MKTIYILTAIVLCSCGSVTAPDRVLLSYGVELINGSMSHVYYVAVDGDMVAIECEPGDSLYQFEFSFPVGAKAGAGAYPGETSVVAVIIRENGERVLAEYILENEPTMWYWTVGE